MKKQITMPVLWNYLKKLVFPVLFFYLLSVTNLYSQGSVTFAASELAGTALITPTSLQFGPDGRLYVSQQNGEIKIFTIERIGDNNYQVVATETILLIKNIPNHDDNGTVNPSITSRQVTGILVTGTAANPVIFVSSSDSRVGGGASAADKNLDTNSGMISKLTWNGTAWSKLDLVKGLPRSEENHSSNGLQLDEATNTLYLAQGGNTNAGSPSNNFVFICEYALSASILAIDLSRIETEFGGTYILPTLDDPTRPNTGPNGSDENDPFGGNDGLNQAKLIPGGPVQIYSPGYRNPYDIVITKAPGKEGRLYTVDNGANGGWGGHPDQEGAFGDPLTTNVTNKYVVGEPGSTTAGPNDAKVNNLDNLHLVSKPGLAPIYGGHPNPIRANPAGAGWYWFNNDTNIATYNASPTGDWPPVPLTMANPVEGDFRNPGVDDGALYTWASSTNGLAEYTSSNFFDGGMVGDLLTVAFDGNLYRIKLNDEGTAVEFVDILASGFGSIPLDVIAQGTDDVFEGSIWVANYASGNIVIFEPRSGCDGIINTSVLQSSNTLISLATAATYQWINCTDNTDIAGATEKTFTVTEPGSYAVRITQGACTEVSSCITISEIDTFYSLRINTGGEQQLYGVQLWEEDQYFSTGNTFSNPATIANTEFEKLYQSERYGANFSYEIPVPYADKYLVRLHFAEIYFTEAGKRIFNVDIEGSQGSLTNYDIFQKAGGPNTAVSETFFVDVTDGFLSLSFSALINNAKISAIEVLLCTDPTISSVIASPPAVCEDGTSTILVNGSLRSASAWNLYSGSCGGTLVASNSLGVFEVKPVGNTMYYVRAEGGCTAPVTCETVEVAIESIATSIVISGNTLIATPAGATYQWINCNGNIDMAGSTGRFFTPQESGSYAVRVTVEGCKSTSACVDFIVVGLSTESTDMISVYPNPAQSRTKIYLPGYSFGYSYSITDTQGRLIMSGAVLDSPEIEVNLESFGKGVYFIHIMSEQVRKTVKLIVN